MKIHRSFRLCLGAALAALLSAAPAQARWRGPQPARPAPALKPNRTQSRPAVRPPAKVERQSHIANWMDQHKGMSVPDQLKALGNEPGFRQLDPQTQQRMRDQLVQLNNMPPERRERRLEQNEILERMSVPQRQQYRAAVQNYAVLPPERRRLLARAVVDLRQMPPEQRQSVIDSDRFRAQFSDGERSTLTSLLAVEPYPPIAVGP